MRKQRSIDQLYRAAGLETAAHHASLSKPRALLSGTSAHHASLSKPRVMLSALKRLKELGRCSAHRVEQ